LGGGFLYSRQDVIGLDFRTIKMGLPAVSSAVGSVPETIIRMTPSTEPHLWEELWS
jgi:hypothetical protein